MVEDNLCRECDSKLDPKLKYYPNCKCNVGMEKIDDTPQKMRSQNPFQKFAENIVWGIMMLVIGGYQLLTGNEWYFQIIGY